MTRKTAREIAIQKGFAAAATEQTADEMLESFFSEEHYATLAAEDELYSDYPDPRSMEYIRRLVGLMDRYSADINNYIRKYSKDWKLERISRTALAVMRCAMCEILYMEDVPNAAAINEAVELDKGYDEPETVSFVNGVLGGFVRGELGEKAETGDPIE